MSVSLSRSSSNVKFQKFHSDHKAVFIPLNNFSHCVLISMCLSYVTAMAKTYRWQLIMKPSQNSQTCVFITSDIINWKYVSVTHPNQLDVWLNVEVIMLSWSDSVIFFNYNMLIICIFPSLWYVCFVWFGLVLPSSETKLTYHECGKIIWYLLDIE